MPNSPGMCINDLADSIQANATSIYVKGLGLLTPNTKIPYISRLTASRKGNSLICDCHKYSIILFLNVYPDR